MGRKQLVVVLALVVAVVGAVAVASSRGDGKPSKPTRPGVMRGVGDDNANLMRRLQRDARARSHR